MLTKKHYNNEIKVVNKLLTTPNAERVDVAYNLKVQQFLIIYSKKIKTKLIEKLSANS